MFGILDGFKDLVEAAEKMKGKAEAEFQEALKDIEDPKDREMVKNLFIRAKKGEITVDQIKKEFSGYRSKRSK